MFSRPSPSASITALGGLPSGLGGGTNSGARQVRRTAAAPGAAAAGGSCPPAQAGRASRPARRPGVAAGSRTPPGTSPAPRRSSLRPAHSADTAARSAGREVPLRSAVRPAGRPFRSSAPAWNGRPAHWSRPADAVAVGRAALRLHARPDSGVRRNGRRLIVRRRPGRHADAHRQPNAHGRKETEQSNAAKSLHGSSVTPGSNFRFDDCRFQIAMSSNPAEHSRRAFPISQTSH